MKKQILFLSAVAPGSGLKVKKKFGIAALIIAVLAGIAIFALPLFFTMYSIPGPSMEPVLKAGDRIIANNLYYKNHDVKRGDIVVIKYVNIMRIYRVLGLPGETIAIKENEVYIDGEYYPEEYIKADPDFQPPLETPLNEYTLLSGEYFVLGDNRTASRDSRFIGPVTKDQITGKYIFTIIKSKR